MRGKFRAAVSAAAAVGAICVMASSAFAGSITSAFADGEYHPDTGINGVSTGGEIIVTTFTHGFLTPFDDVSTAADKANGALFNTFCIERNEFLPNAVCTDLNIQAINGGQAGGNPDPLGKDTAQLYYSFWTNTWADTTGAGGPDLSTNGYSYGPTDRADDAAAMQLAIWWLENELDFTFNDLDELKSHNARAGEFVDYAIAVEWDDLGKANFDSINGGIGHVLVMNNTKADGSARQDTLVVVPLPPAALSGLALLAGLGLIGVSRRRRRKTAA